jgi:probable O-glycosylation ligase (exosortase A-associated)
VAIAFSVWVTFTTTQAVNTIPAWDKWNWAFESILVTVATPIFLRSRAQLETAFVVTLSAFSAHVLTAGAKTVFGTGGYDRLGTLIPTNNWLGETSTLAIVAIMSIPMAYYVVRHSKILKPYRGLYLNAALVAYAFLAIMCMVGTSARTGLVAIAVLLLIGIKSYIRRAIVLAAAVLFVLYGQSLLPSKSLARFNTIATYKQDDSAEIRIGVWKWALGYVAQHPFGGGFQVFYTDAFPYTKQNELGQLVTAQSKNTAPHSIYFEVLGEQGYVGEVMFDLLIVGGLWGTYRLSRKKKNGQADGWPHTFARTLFVCLILYCAGASFVGIAFQPTLYVILGFYCSLYRLTKARVAAPVKFSARAVTHAAPV